MQTDTLIIGGGLSGLRLADLMQQADHDYLLVEARDRLGGRVLSEPVGDSAFDLGPAWFWHGQPRMAALAQRFGLDVFEQYSTGNFRFENAQGQVAEGHNPGSMQGSLRINGGLGSLIDALCQTLDAARIRTAVRVTALTQDASGITAQTNGGDAITAQRVVMALPPRVAANVTFTPALPAPALQAMQNVPTWMAGQAKAVALYDSPFWREAGLSGDAMSQRGPMVEIHDASPATGGPYALFGFIGVPAEARQDADTLRHAVAAQFSRLFGPDAPEPRDVMLKDWAADPLTTSDADLAPLYAHPRYGMSPALRDLWNGSLIVSGTETAATFGGYLEGALEAAEATFQTVDQKALSA